MRFNDIAGGNEGSVDSLAPGHPDGAARGDRCRVCSRSRALLGGLRRRRPPAIPARWPVTGGGGSGPTVAFESIDGPPPQVFDRMVGVLNSESKLRNLSIVSREGSRLLSRAQLSRRRRSAAAAP